MRLSSLYGGKLRHFSMPVALPDGQPPGDFWCLVAADIDGVAACCPALQHMALNFAMRCSPEALHSLLQLHGNGALRDLSIAGPCFTDDAGPSLAQMTSLEYLAISDAPEFTVTGLQHLTSLGQLTQLCFDNCGCSGPPLGVRIPSSSDDAIIQFSEHEEEGWRLSLHGHPKSRVSATYCSRFRNAEISEFYNSDLTFEIW